jgi:hypothetical protein
MSPVNHGSPSTPPSERVFAQCEFAIVVSKFVGVSLVKFPALAFLVALLLVAASAAQNSEEGLHAPDGGVLEQFNSILLPAIPHAPFTSIVTAEWTKVLEDGTTITVHNRRLVVRDSAGRIYQERRRLIPIDSSADPDLQRIEISDPVAHKKYFCRPETHECMLRDYSSPENASQQPMGEQQDSFGTLTTEDLGKNFVNGVEAIGTRETRTVNAGAIGNDHAISFVKEIWYSSQLGINVSVKRMDPRHGTQVINATEITQGEPAPSYFRLPTGYTVVDLRSATVGRAQGVVPAGTRK